MKAHPYADKFPMLPEHELVELAESIRANGLRQPIVVTTEGLILDGRNRAAACSAIGVEPETVVYEGEDLAAYVIDCNVTRRNMSTGARAMSTALVLAEDGRREGGRWKRGSVSGIGESANNYDWQARLKECGVILDHAPDLAEFVVDGTTTLNDALRQAEQRRDAERDRLAEEERLAQIEADAEAFITENSPDLAALVGEGKPFLTYAEAHAIWEQRNREEAERRRRQQEEERKRLAAEKRARVDLYSQIAVAIQGCAVYGDHADIDHLMGAYDPSELNPPQLARAMRGESLLLARKFLDALIAWESAR